jgi:fructokinase
MSDEIICIGELLWDALPAGLFLGGAPFNVACHLHALGHPAAVASRVGDDVLGREALRRLRARGLDDALVQVDDARPTGFVRVDLTAADDPDYDIVAPAAWDGLARTAALEARVADATALVFGSLAQRAVPARDTIRALAGTDVRCVFDVNLRAPYDDRAVVAPSLRLADVVKLNEEELARLGRWFDLPDAPADAMAALARSFDCSAVCVTAGAEGARLWQAGTHVRHPGHPTTVTDTVGAGDAFLAALLSGLLAGHNGDTLLDRANRLGAFVAAHDGAVPAYEVDGLDALRTLSPPAAPTDA